MCSSFTNFAIAAFSRAQPSLSPGCRSSPSVEMPRISKPCEAYWLCSSMSQGVSILQGPHQVAQKLMSTALPLKLASETFCPLRSSSVKGGRWLVYQRETGSEHPAAASTSSPCAAEASARSAACLRYSQLAQPAQANVARMKKVTPRTMVLRFTGIRPLYPHCTREDSEQ